MRLPRNRVGDHAEDAQCTSTSPTPAKTPSRTRLKRGSAYVKLLQEILQVPVRVSATLRSTAQISRRTSLSSVIGGTAVRTRMPRSNAPVMVYGTNISGSGGSCIPGSWRPQSRR